MDYLIVGLGNPGQKYQNTRHNVGFRAADFIAENTNTEAFTESTHAETVTAQGSIGGRSVLLAKPQTYMNKSGKAVAALARYFDIPQDHILIIHDELDIEFGELKFSFGAGGGGHNGVLSVISALDTREFARLRVGINSDDTRSGDPKDARSYVLASFSSEQEDSLAEMLPVLLEGVNLWIKTDSQAAMNKVNT
jgi:PTH1 family peptidyl-tRNA hydrolase